MKGIFTWAVGIPHKPFCFAPASGFRTGSLPHVRVALRGPAARVRRAQAALGTTATFLVSASVSVAEPAWPISDGPGLTFYGQINQAFLNYDDSIESRGFFTVDNATNENGSGFGLLYDGTLGNGLDYSARFELGVTPRPSNTVSLQNPAGESLEFDTDDIEYLEVAFGRPDAGRFYFGKGDMTANLSAPDYSGTSVIAGPNMSQIAGAMVLRNEDGTLSDRTLSDAIGTYDSGRKFRLRYDSASYNGFAFSGSVGWDVEDSDDDDTYLDAQVSYSGKIPNWRYDVVLDVTSIGEDDYAAMASFAFLHSSGLNLTTTHAKSNADAHYYFIKMGFLQNRLPIGPTAFSVEYYNNGDWVVPGSEAKSIGVSLVQYVSDYDLQIYGSFRTYQAYTNLDIPGEDFQDGNAVMAGLLWQF
jgi:hypothetical protein